MIKDLVVKSPYTARYAFSTLNIKQDGTSAGFLTFVDRYIKNVYIRYLQNLHTLKHCV